MYNKKIKLRSGLNEGYRYFCDKNHPLAKGNSGMVLYHRHILSIKTGRWVTFEEVVHHIDHNKLNNADSNLEVLSRSDHGKLPSPNVLLDIVCAPCNLMFHPRNSTQVYCSDTCRTTSYIKNKLITKEDLERDIWFTPYSNLTTQYGLSDVGLKKRASALGCRIPPPYFHSKSEKYKTELRNINNIS